VVKIIKQGRQDGLQPGKDYGLLAYNENPFYEVIENGISSIGIDWNEMGHIAADFVLNDKPVQIYLPTVIKKRGSL
jgi:DNA-binding LacI/PurR family transcriptional regulator